MSEAEALFAVLRKSADAEAVSAIERLVQDGLDRELCRINALAFAAKALLGEERVIAAFLHAARIGLFDLSWNVLCPGCGGVLDDFLDIKGEATRERQNLSLVFNKVRAPTGTIELRPGPFRLSLENRTNARVLP